MLIFHFIGLAMGLGTSFGFMFLGIAASKMEIEKARSFTINTLALSKMGYIGITLLIITGFYLITPYWSILADFPFLIVKLGLVLVLVVLIILLGAAAKKAKQGDFERQIKKIQMLGRFSLLTAVTIVVMAVLTFS